MNTKLNLTLACCIALVGCTKPQNESTTPGQHDAHDQHDHGHAASHPEHGPHGGDLVELGDETFHAEVVHNNSGVLVYMLDSSATEPVAIGTSAPVTLSMKHDGEVKTFNLLPSPIESDPDGQASRFDSTDETLHAWLEAGAEGALIAEIQGRSYTGQVTHSHGHDEHEHEESESHADSHSDGHH